MFDTSAVSKEYVQEQRSNAWYVWSEAKYTVLKVNYHISDEGTWTKGNNTHKNIIK